MMLMMSEDGTACGVIRVLLADDHFLIRKGLAAMIEEARDMELVGEAGDGEQAVNLANALSPDIILMDVTMPRMDGIEATRRIRQDLPEARIIGLSMHVDEQIRQSMLEAGALSYMTKGDPSDELLSEMRRFANRSVSD